MAKEHSIKLRRAIAVAQLTYADLAVALGVSPRTITNWTSKVNPTLPKDRDLEKLARLLPGYAESLDPIESAIRTSTELAPFRQSQLIAEYQRLLHEQGLEDERLAQ